MPSGVTFEAITGDAATIEGAIQAFRDHHWVHLACHGAQDADKPFDSWLAMRNGPLTLMHIIQERYTCSGSCLRATRQWGTRLRQTRRRDTVCGVQWCDRDVVVGDYAARSRSARQTGYSSSFLHL